MTTQNQQMQKTEKKDPSGQTGAVERVPREGRLEVMPPVDVYEGQDETWLVADLPGVKKEDLEIELHNNELRLRAHAVERFEEAAFDYTRSFRLPPGIDGEKVVADLKDGVLTLKLPKPNELRPKRIEVKTA